jgi:hypothetical protein
MGEILIASEGDDFIVDHLDRGYRGRQRTVFRVNGRSGEVQVSGAITLNGEPVLTTNTVVQVQDDPFTPDSDQVFFSLSRRPLAGTVKMFVNGVLQKQGSGFDFDVIDQAVTWLENGYQLSSSDSVVFTYYWA